MSFGEKLTAIMQRPGEDLVAKDDVPWWLKYSGRGLGTVGGGIAIIMGLFNIITSIFNVSCILGSICLMLAGFTVVVVEAPCCCLFLDFVQNFSDIVEKRPYWNRAAFYCALGIVPLILCLGVSIFFGSGLIFATGLIYGMMAIGKKASFHEMRTSAASATASQASASTSTKSNLVQNAQPVSFTNPPDSIV
ncbi:calcium channel flower isoform X1 [Leptopilina heterotoma]|uniref:calcium channel flower isoform X1 n=1 Tax=Leptopilina heterotoma TaxID=63436 RepID=UPI001CA88B5F|nr:calcium channel flower isoform X1 [Leptopilina heterotoma]